MVYIVFHFDKKSHTLFILEPTKTNYMLSENEKNFRRYLQHYHPDKYKEYMKQIKK